MEPQESTQNDIDFAAAFEEGLSEGIAAIVPALAPAIKEDTPVEPALSFPATPAPAEEPAPAPAEPAPAPAEPAPAPAEPAPVPAPAEPAPAPVPQAAVDWEARARALEAQLAVRPTPAPVAPALEAPTEAAPVYTQEETELLTAYQTDWPDIAKAEALTRRAEYRQLLDYVFTKVQEQLAPVQQYTQEASGDMHYNKLTQAHADYDQIVDKVEEWVAKQPEFLRKSLTEVATSGDTNDVIELVSMYKRATGAQPAAIAPPPVVIPPATTHPSKQAAAQRLSPVSSQRTNSQATGAIPETFEEAFKVFSMD